MRNLSIEELKELRALCNDSAAWASVLDELISIRELKGEQVPVALVDERQGSGGFCLTQHGRSLNLPHGAELFTHPQKPIALPEPTFVDMLSEDDDSVMRDGDYVWRVDDVIAAIEAAGGSVKDGD